MHVRRDAFLQKEITLTVHFKKYKGMSLRCRRQNSAGKPREGGYVDPRVGDKAEGKVGIVGPRYELSCVWGQ
jgi:hypothetical protein